MAAPALDQAVLAAAAALPRSGVAAPASLFLLATGAGLLPSRLRDGRRLPLGRLPGVPSSWSQALLHHGEFRGLQAWILEDAREEHEGEPPWAAAFPVWLAGAAGATALVHAAAGTALAGLATGTFALLADHVNLSGATPLAGLGESRLGPLFPDPGRLHDPHLRHAALAQCRKLGLAAAEVVGALTAGPSLETGAEQRWFRAAGCDVSVQGLAPALLAAAHAGLGTLSIVPVAAQAGEATDFAKLAAVARSLQPALDDLLWGLAGEVQARASAALGEDLDEGGERRAP